MYPDLFHVIKDPVHGTMQFTSVEDHWVKPFIDSPNFQRLRNIKQLGMGDFIFPGAVHSRFNHSLGCCYVASQVAHKIGLADEERQLVMIACLLHDIGHGPFSHAFEDIFQDKFIRHEDWTPYFLADYATKEFFTDFNHLNPRYHLSEEKFKEIEKMIMHKPVEKRVLADIVSSQLDADRLDYLLRDSHFCGVTYGQFDFRWMLHCMTIIEAEHGERLGITHKGMGVVEHYLMARRLMMRNIYHSEKKLALEYYIVQLLAVLAADMDAHPQAMQIKSTRLGQFLLAVNYFNASFSTVHAAKHKRDFLEKNYQNYKELCDYDVFALIKQLAADDNDHPATQLAVRLQKRIMPKIKRLEHVNLQDVKTELQAFKKAHLAEFQDWQIGIIQTPHRSYSGDEDPILIRTETSIKPITELSLLIQSISNKLEHVAFICVDAEISENKHLEKWLKKW